MLFFFIVSPHEMFLCIYILFLYILWYELGVSSCVGLRKWQQQQQNEINDQHQCTQCVHKFASSKKKTKYVNNM